MRKLLFRARWSRSRFEFEFGVVMVGVEVVVVVFGVVVRIAKSLSSGRRR